MYERDLFFMTKTLSLEAVVKEECELSPWNNWPLSCRSWGQWKSEGNGKHSSTDSGETGRTPGECVRLCLWSCTPPPSLCPVNWNTKQSGVDERVLVVRRRGGGLLSVSSSTFTARWELTGEPASETDTLSLVKWTVTLHFSTSWQHRIGRFEPCDVTLIEFWFSPSRVLKEDAGLISSVQALHAKYPGRQAHQHLGRELCSQPVSLDQCFHGRSVRPRHPSLFHCAASLLCLSASLVFLSAYSHGGLTGTWRRKTIRGSHLDPGGNPGEY